MFHSRIHPNPWLILAMLWCCGQVCAAGTGETPGILATSDEQFFVVFETDPNPIPQNAPFSIVVSVYEDREQTRSAKDIELTVDGRMPQHRHGMNTTPVIKALENGKFEVQGMLFHMVGLWQLHFDITRDGETVRAQTTILLE